MTTLADVPRPTTARERLFRNGLYNSGSWILNVLVVMLATPYILAKLSSEGYGIYALLTGLVGYYGLLDFGLGQGVTKFVAEFAAKKNQEGINRSINAALWFQGITGLTGSALVTVFALPILGLFAIPPLLLPASRIGLYLSAIGFFFTMLSGTLSAALMGLQRYDLTSKISVCVNVGLTISIVIALILGGGLVSTVTLTMISSVGMLILYTLVLKKQLPDYRFSLHYDKEFLPILSKFSGYMFISKISNIFSQYVVRFVVGFFLGPSAVTYYVLPAKLLNAVGGVLSGAFGVLFPFASELAANQDPVRIRRIYVDSSRLFAALAIPLLLFLALFSHQILEVWLGTDLADKGSTLLTLLALSGLVGSLTTVPNMIVMGLGHSKVIGLFSVLTVVVYIVSLPILTRNVGLTGTGYAMILATIPGIVLVGFQLKKILLIDIRSYLRQVFGFHVFPAVIVIVVIVLCDLRTYPTILVLGVGTVFLILYFVLMVATKWVKLK